MHGASTRGPLTPVGPAINGALWLAWRGARGEMWPARCGVGVARPQWGGLDMSKLKACRDAMPLRHHIISCTAAGGGFGPKAQRIALDEWACLWRSMRPGMAS